MADKYAGKVALVTGASSGIGAAIAQHLVAHYGMHVVACGRRFERLKGLQKGCKNAELLLHPYKCDLTSFQEIKAMMEWIEHTFGDLRVVINNAGVMMYGPLLKQTPQDWTAMMDVNLIAVSYITQLATGKIMLTQERPLDVIFINSMAGHVQNDNPMTAMYNAGKYALTGLIEQWRRELVNRDCFC